MSTVDSNAHEFGLHFRQGGWRMGFLVACSVQPGKPGRPRKRPRVDDFASPLADEQPEDDELSEGSEDVEMSEGEDFPSPLPDVEMSEDQETAENSENQGKVSISEFAAKAGVGRSKQTVAYYYNAWELAADDELVPHAEDLSPDDEVLENIGEDDEHTRDQWSIYLQKAKEPKEPKEPSQPKPSDSHGSNAAGADPGSKGKKTQQDQLHRAVEQVNTDMQRTSEHLHTLVKNVSMGTKAVFPGLAQDMRALLDVHEKQGDQMHQVLDFIGYADVGDTEDEDVEDDEDGTITSDASQDTPDVGEPEF